MRLAVSAGGGAPENRAYVQVAAGRPRARRAATWRAARDAYLGALRSAARATRRRWSGSRAWTRRRGDLARPPIPRCGAPRGCSRSPTTLTLLADVELAAGRARAAARRTSRPRAPQRRLYRAAGTAPDAEAVLFEAAARRPGARPCGWAGASGARRRACARRTRSAGRSPGPGGRAAGLRWARRGAEAGLARSAVPLPRRDRRRGGGPAGSGRRHLRIALRGRAACSRRSRCAQAREALAVRRAALAAAASCARRARGVAAPAAAATRSGTSPSTT